MSSKNILITFGERVQRIRKRARPLTRKIGRISRRASYLYWYDRAAEKNITLINIEKIAKALNVNTKDLL